MAGKRQSPEVWQREATFVFRGLVIAVKDGTAIIRVDEVLRGPELLQQYIGSNISARLDNKEKLAVGDESTFYTHTVTVGETLVVQSLGHVNAPATAATSKQIDQALRAQVTNADIVVTGKVTSVRMPRSDSSGASGTRVTVSEHEPMWREAVIRVTGVERGGKAPEEIVVRFPASTDVMWSNIPKLETGQQGVFLLSRSPENVRSGTSASHAILSVAAVQPIQNVEQVRSIIRSKKL